MHTPKAIIIMGIVIGSFFYICSAIGFISYFTDYRDKRLGRRLLTFCLDFVVFSLFCMTFIWGFFRLYSAGESLGGFFGAACGFIYRVYDAIPVLRLMIDDFNLAPILAMLFFLVYIMWKRYFVGSGYADDAHDRDVDARYEEENRKIDAYNASLEKKIETTYTVTPTYNGEYEVERHDLDVTRYKSRKVNDGWQASYLFGALVAMFFTPVLLGVLCLGIELIRIIVGVFRQNR